MRLVLAGLAMVVAGMDPESRPGYFREKDVPILQQNVRAVIDRQIAPMSLLVSGGGPWQERSGRSGAGKCAWSLNELWHFRERSFVKQSEIDTLVKWSDSGAPKVIRRSAGPGSMANRRLDNQPGGRHGSAAHDVPREGTLEWELIALRRPSERHWSPRWNSAGRPRRVITFVSDSEKHRRRRLQPYEWVRYRRETGNPTPGNSGF